MRAATGGDRADHPTVAVTVNTNRLPATGSRYRHDGGLIVNRTHWLAAVVDAIAFGGHPRTNDCDSAEGRLGMWNKQ